MKPKQALKGSSYSASKLIAYLNKTQQCLKEGNKNPDSKHPSIRDVQCIIKNTHMYKEGGCGTHNWEKNKSIEAEITEMMELTDKDFKMATMCSRS